MDRVKLYVPTERELDYRRRLIADEGTMSYNAGYGENGTGCYHQSPEQVQAWYRHWKGRPGRYYAYIVLTGSRQPVGEVNIYWNSMNQRHMVGIVVEACHRGKGYGQQALRLLVRTAFEEYGLEALYDDFSPDRQAAERVFLNAGFQRVDGSLVCLTRERYEERQKALTEKQ